MMKTFKKYDVLSTLVDFQVEMPKRIMEYIEVETGLKIGVAVPAKEFQAYKKAFNDACEELKKTLSIDIKYELLITCNSEIYLHISHESYFYIVHFLPMSF